MSSQTPPAAPFDVQAHAFADAMVKRADAHRMGGIAPGGPLWGRWALVEAFAAGRAAKEAETIRATVVDDSGPCAACGKPGAYGMRNNVRFCDSNCARVLRLRERGAA
jgi:hypothetical protein